MSTYGALQSEIIEKLESGWKLTFGDGKRLPACWVLLRDGKISRRLNDRRQADGRSVESLRRRGVIAPQRGNDLVLTERQKKGNG